MGRRKRKYPSTLFPLFEVLRNEICNTRITVLSHSDPLIAKLGSVTVLYETFYMLAIRTLSGRELLIEKRSGTFQFTVRDNLYSVPGQYLVGDARIRQKRKLHIW